MSLSFTITQLAQIVGGTLRGHDDRRLIRGVNDVEAAQADQATWVSNPKYESKLAASAAGVVLAPKDFGATPMPAILCDRIDRSIALLLGAFAPSRGRRLAGVHPSAVVDPSASIGEDSVIGPCAVIEEDARIGTRCTIGAGVFIGFGSTLGDDCHIWPNVVIRDGCIVGSRVEIHPNAVIGADGFGFYFDQGRHHRVPHIGGVRIEDDVEIGSCSCIDRSKFGYTVIGRGTKVDNLVQLAHNLQVGQHCIFAGQTGIGGSVKIGNYSVFGGQTSVSDNVSLGEEVRVAIGSVVWKDVPSGLTVSGNPAQDHRTELRAQASLRRLPDMTEQLKELIARVEKLEASTHHQS